MGRSRRCAPATAPAQGQPDVPRQTELVVCNQSIERTFSWCGQSRRLSKDYERLCATSEAVVYLAMTRIMLKRLARA